MPEGLEDLADSRVGGIQPPVDPLSLPYCWVSWNALCCFHLGSVKVPVKTEDLIQSVLTGNKHVDVW